MKLSLVDVVRFSENIIPEPTKAGCWLWIGTKASNGYGKFWLNGKNLSAHRIVWMRFNGPIPKDHCVCHHCDNKACVNPRHLFVGTHADNHADRNAKNRQSKGETHGSAKLSNEDVREIFRLRNEGLSQEKVASRFGVRLYTIQRILNGLGWKHLTPTYRRGVVT